MMLVVNSGKVFVITAYYCCAIKCWIPRITKYSIKVKTIFIPFKYNRACFPAYLDSKFPYDFDLFVINKLHVCHALTLSSKFFYISYK
jgi:hypothetical protein